MTNLHVDSWRIHPDDNRALIVTISGIETSFYMPSGLPIDRVSAWHEKGRVNITVHYCDRRPFGYRIGTTRSGMIIDRISSVPMYKVVKNA